MANPYGGGDLLDSHWVNENLATPASEEEALTIADYHYEGYMTAVDSVESP